MSTHLQGTGMLLRSQKSHPQNNSIKRWYWREVGSALLIGTISLLKEVHKRPLIFPSCKRGEEGEEEEERGVPVCECEYTHTLAKVHVCKQKTTLDVSLGFYLTWGRVSLFVADAQPMPGRLAGSFQAFSYLHFPSPMEPWDYRYVLQCQAFSNTCGLRNSNSGSFAHAPNILPTEPSPQFQKLSSNELGTVSSSDPNLSWSCTSQPPGL